MFREIDVFTVDVFLYYEEGRLLTAEGRFKQGHGWLRRETRDVRGRQRVVLVVAVSQEVSTNLRRQLQKTRKQRCPWKLYWLRRTKDENHPPIKASQSDDKGAYLMIELLGGEAGTVHWFLTYQFSSNSAPDRYSVHLPVLFQEK